MATTSISSVASEPEHNTKSRELEEENATKTGAADDEDTGAQVAPIVKLEEVPVTTGEEDEDAILDLKAKLYRFVKEGNQWKERGVGTVKLLKHKDSAKVHLVFRQSKTLKICANHLGLHVFLTLLFCRRALIYSSPQFLDGLLLFCLLILL
uniref:RanBD1 domain-containing protein n=1 Tax=Populus davidiana TaxID=266767 RepID=A0A6M2EYC7_9ROSI